jgi:membrane protease YdiL (CAAX protease family)
MLGFQIAFLVLAFDFFMMLTARAIAPVVGWPAERFEDLGQTVSIAMGFFILFGVPALRQRCLAELARPIPSGATPELAFATSLHLAIPFAIVGFSVTQHFLSGQAADLTRQASFDDLQATWNYALSPLGIFHALALSWTMGPLLEELLYRGLLYRAFERAYGWIPAMILTSVIFGLSHPTHVVSAGLGSVVYVCILRRFGTLRATILVHATYNFLISWPLFGQLLFTQPPGSPTDPRTWTLFLGCFAFVLLSLPAYLWLARTQRPALAPA